MAVGAGAVALITWLTNSGTICNERLLKPLLTTVSSEIGTNWNLYSQNWAALGSEPSFGLLHVSISSSAAIVDPKASGPGSVSRSELLSVPRHTMRVHTRRSAACLVSTTSSSGTSRPM